MAAFVLYTSKLVAGAAIVATSLIPVKLTLGINIPLLTLLTSSIAELWAVTPVVFTARLCAVVFIAVNSAQTIKQLLLICFNNEIFILWFFKQLSFDGGDKDIGIFNPSISPKNRIGKAINDYWIREIFSIINLHRSENSVSDIVLACVFMLCGKPS